VSSALALSKDIHSASYRWNEAGAFRSIAGVMVLAAIIGLGGSRLDQLTPHFIEVISCKTIPGRLLFSLRYFYYET
jgi:hypothetical protein